jgi:branched chain amino acid efflux pump
MSPGWAVVLLAGAGTMLLKAAGPLVLAGRASSPRLRNVLARLAPATFGALIAIDTFTSGHALTVDPRVAALALGVVGAWRRVPAVVVLASAVLTVAVLRRLW